MLGKLLGEKTAPELSGIKGWLNSSPLTLPNLRGRVVLLDFWTYSCVNCLRTLPHMKYLHEQYTGNGFVLIGVHTPEFEFERTSENVADAVKRFDIKYAVALDSDNLTWKLYGNQYWPRQALLDGKGRIRWEHAGEGDYDTMENRVRDLLREAGKRVPALSGKRETVRASEKSDSEKVVTSPEIYTGSLRSLGFGNGQVCVPGSCTRFLDPGDHQRDTVYLHGDWTQFPEYVMHNTDEPGYAVLKFTGGNANAVLGTLNAEPVRVGVELDGSHLDRGRGGEDVQWDSGESIVYVKNYRLFDIVRTKGRETHELKLTTNHDGLRIYTYTFG